MLQPNFFNNVFVIPILNVLLLFYKVFSTLRIPGDFGWSVIGLTVLVRLILHPFFKQQIETAKKMAEIKPHLDRLSKKHQKDPKTLQQEQLKLYQQAGINPASGCLFMIIQIPIFIGLYNTLSLFLLNGGKGKIINEINKVLYFSFLKIQTINPWFFGFNLALIPAKSGQWHYYLIPIITGILQYLQVAASQPASTEISVDKENLTKEKKDIIKHDQKDKVEEKDDFQKAMNTQMKFVFPLMIAWFSYSLPVGLSLYWNIFSIFTIIQYRKVYKK
ncbi:MAG: YidC/Oxa1 family membrane protein insertase [Microgenomates group bacterium]|jgi:YidC/Oxa1 family membrane protein insertase|nr:YidC/Oxa1 family membrane protein insertase [Microgenomates group bacterium]